MPFLALQPSVYSFTLKTESSNWSADWKCKQECLRLKGQNCQTQLQFKLHSSLQSRPSFKNSLEKGRLFLKHARKTDFNLVMAGNTHCMSLFYLLKHTVYLEKMLDRCSNYQHVLYDWCVSNTLKINFKSTLPFHCFSSSVYTIWWSLPICYS